MIVAFAVLALRVAAVGDLMAHYSIYRHSSWETKGHRWEFVTYWHETAKYGEDSHPEHLHRVLRDCRIVKTFADRDRPEWEPWGLFLAAQKVAVRSPYEAVVAIRGAGGLGVHWDTRFYGFRGPNMTYIGRAPSQNANGPINWRGRSDRWLFDDFDYYEEMHEHKGVTAHRVFSIERGKTMHRVGMWPSKKKVKRVVWLKELE